MSQKRKTHGGGSGYLVDAAASYPQRALKRSFQRSEWRPADEVPIKDEPLCAMPYRGKGRKRAVKYVAADGEDDVL